MPILHCVDKRQKGVAVCHITFQRNYFAVFLVNGGEACHQELRR
jgi:hypothetical protein